MKDIKEFNIEDNNDFSDLVDRIHQSHVYAGGNFSKAGLRENLRKILNSWGSSDGDYVLFLALFFYRGDPYGFKKNKPQTHLFENEYQGYAALFGMLKFIEAAGVKGDLKDLWWDLGYHVRVFRDEGDLQPPIDAQMFFQDEKINILLQTCTTREDLLNQVRHFESYPAIKLFYANYPDLALSLDFSTIVFIHELDLISNSAK